MQVCFKDQVLFKKYNGLGNTMRKTFLLIGYFIFVAGCTTSSKQVPQAPVLDATTGTNNTTAQPKTLPPVLESHDLSVLPTETIVHPLPQNSTSSGNSRFRKRVVPTAADIKQKACKPAPEVKAKPAKTKAKPAPKKAKPTLKTKPEKAKTKTLHKAKPVNKAKHKSKK